MSRTFKALKTATLATVALSPVVYLNNSLYLKALAVKRASIAFYYEGKILLSYKIVNSFI